MFVECPLCGAVVHLNEIQTWGYCKICRQLVEVLTSHVERRRMMRKGLWGKMG